MSKIDALLEKAEKAGKEFEQRKEEKSQEMEKASAAVTAAAMEIEQAALAGDEAAYALAKDKRAAAQNRLEILQIREKKKVGKEDIETEINKLLSQLENDCSAEIRKMCREFISRYDELIKYIDEIDRLSMRYNSVREYYKSYVLKSPQHHFRYMAEMTPVKLVIAFRDKFKFNRSEIEKLTGTSNGWL